MGEIKVVAVSKEGEPVRVGRDFIELKDKTDIQFSTNIIGDFLGYLGTSKVALYYNESGIIAYPILIEHETGAKAVCSMQNDPFLSSIISLNGDRMSVENFELALYNLRSFYDVAGKNLYDNARNFVVDKITHMERSSDNQGNFHYNVTRKSGAGSVNPPERIKFTVPVFAFLPDTIELSFDVFMEYEEGEGKVKVFFILKNPALNVELKQRQKEIIEEQLAAVTCPKFWGSLKVVQGTDSWKYQDNGLKT
jgi:hypothetical protein